MADQANEKWADHAPDQGQGTAAQDGDAQAPEFAPTQMHEPEFAPTQMHEPEFTPTRMHEAEFAATRVEEQEFAPTQMHEPDFAATEVLEPVALGEVWSESTDGRCSEDAALFAASQPAPLSVV